RGKPLSRCVTTKRSGTMRFIASNRNWTGSRWQAAEMGRTKTELESQTYSGLQHFWQYGADRLAKHGIGGVVEGCRFGVHDYDLRACCLRNFNCARDRVDLQAGTD